MATTLLDTRTPRRVAPAVVDADIHNTVSSFDELLPYLAPEWRAYAERFGSRNYRTGGSFFPRVSPAAARNDA